MNLYRIRHSHRWAAQDPVIGWISTADTLLFGLAFFLILAASLSATLSRSILEKETLASEKAVVLEHNRDLEQDLKVQGEKLVSLQREFEDEKKSSASLTARLTARHTSDQAIIQDLRIKGSTLWKTHQELKEQLKSTESARLSALTELTALKKNMAEADAMRLKYKAIENEYAVLQAKYEALQESVLTSFRDEKSVRSELIGLKGKLNRVAILFDASESMKEGERWESAQTVIAAWLEHLAMDECVLIVFNDVVEVYPSDGNMIQLTGEDNISQRDAMLEYLKKFSPIGRTNTLAALQKAYEYDDVDTIVLFTDGSPFVGRTNDRIDSQMVSQIYALCESKKDIPINAVGLGNYFSPELSSFLLKIAEITQGTFVGR